MVVGAVSGVHRKKPPLCKGRWLAKQDGGVVKKLQQEQSLRHGKPCHLPQHLVGSFFNSALCALHSASGNYIAPKKHPEAPKKHPEAPKNPLKPRFILLFGKNW